MKKYAYFAIYWIFGLFFACTQAPEKPVANQLAAKANPVEKLTGYLYVREGIKTLVTCDNGTTYTLADTAQRYEQRLSTTMMMAMCPDQPLWAQVQGVPSPNNTLAVQQIDSLSDLNKFNACRGFDYVCAGTEPFWQVFISAADRSVYFKDIATGEGHTFDYAAPVVANGVTNYTFQQRGKPAQTMQVRIKKEQCSDGMSDNRYPYSAEVRVMGKVLKGCAETPKEMAAQ